MNWLDFYTDLFNNHVCTINNNSKKNIVLFGYCHMATIGYMLNRLLNYEYNIHIIISWFFQHNGIEKFDMNEINNKILNIVLKCDIFIYHSHKKDFHINATGLPSLVNDNCLKLIVPNYRLDYTNKLEEFHNSLNILNCNIASSNFPELKFITENYKNIMFFNTTHHPTHYLLFLQSEYIMNKIFKNGQTITIENYYDEKNRAYFKDFKYVTLPGKENITDEISNVTGITKNAEYFDAIL
jgi:hypothetical protein